jgi:hypothetical protein
MANTLSLQDLEQAPKDTIIVAEVEGQPRRWRKMWTGTGYSWYPMRFMASYTQEQIAKLKPRLAQGL